MDIHLDANISDEQRRKMKQTMQKMQHFVQVAGGFA
jgi:hypothetical protein